MKLQVCAKTDIGLNRKNNEDRFFVDEKRGLFMVADGMGGHAAGEVASWIAMETACQSLLAETQENPREQLTEAVEKANRAVEQEAADHSAHQGMGTTLTIFLLHQQQGYLAHVGDSRMYRLHNSQFEQMSDDHSLVAEQLREGILTLEQAKKSTLGNILLQAIGITPNLDLCQKTFPLAVGDRYLLCSDGLTDMLADTEIAEILKRPGSLPPLCDALIEAALTAGGKDNITVVVVQIDQLDQ